MKGRSFWRSFFCFICFFNNLYRSCFLTTKVTFSVRNLLAVDKAKVESRSFCAPFTQYYPLSHLNIKDSISHAVCSERNLAMLCIQFLSVLFFFAYLFIFIYYAMKCPSVVPIFSLSTSIKRYQGGK